MTQLPLRVRNSKYGWIPDLPDKRDLLYKALMQVSEALPEMVDLRSKDSSIKNQGHLGACTAFALTGNLEFLKRKDDFSQLFLYYNERVIRGMEDSDSGASIRDGIKTLVKIGDCLSDFWPYVIDKFTIVPDEKAYKEALDNQIVSYYRIGSILEMKHTLSLGFPFVFGFSVYESFETPEVAKTGIVPMPEASESLLGGHAVMAVGFIEDEKRFIVRNSWGKAWGDEGYFYLPYEYLTTAHLANDFWTIRGME